MAINMSYSAQEENYMNIIRPVIKKAFVLGNLVLRSETGYKNSGGFSLLFNHFRVRSSSLMNLHCQVSHATFHFYFKIKIQRLQIAINFSWC